MTGSCATPSIERELTIIVNSSDGFEDCWLPFFKIFERQWPSCPFDILLNTETKAWHYPGLKLTTTMVGREGEGRLTWSECLIRALHSVKTPLVLYFQEDYFVSHPIDVARIIDAVRLMLSDTSIRHVALTRHGSLPPFESSQICGYQKISQRAKYRISTQAGLWRRDTLLSYLRENENGWMFEIFGSYRAQRNNETFLVCDFNDTLGSAPIEYVHTGIIKGKWHPDIVPQFREAGLDVDFSRRGFYQKPSFLTNKVGVLRKLFEQPSYSISQIIRIISG